LQFEVLSETFFVSTRKVTLTDAFPRNDFVVTLTDAQLVFQVIQEATWVFSAVLVARLVACIKLSSAVMLYWF